jgi:hypothetical protein
VIGTRGDSQPNNSNAVASDDGRMQARHAPMPANGSTDLAARTRQRAHQLAKRRTRAAGEIHGTARVIRDLPLAKLWTSTPTPVDILSGKFVASWAKKKFVIAGVSVLLEGVIGLLAEAVFHGVMEVLMKLLTCKFGVWWGWAVLWGPLVTPSIRRRCI